MTDISSTFGALLVGGFVAVCLSGVVTVQSFLYLVMNSADSLRTKIIVGVVWSLDALHTGLVCASVWYYLIAHFGDSTKIDFIPWSVPLSILITAILTFLVHCFFVYRIYRLINNSWVIAGPIAILAFLRLLSACVTAAEMIRIKSFSGFAHQFTWIFTLGLALSSVVDVGITSVLCYKLKNTRTSSSSMNQILDSMVLYTFENGALTSAATVISMLCWLIMPHNRIFLAIHFVIGKLYANSLLATLITRNQMRLSRKSVNVHALPVLFPADPADQIPSPNRVFSQHSRSVSYQSTVSKDIKMSGLQISVQREYGSTVDDTPSSGLGLISPVRSSY